MRRAAAAALAALVALSAAGCPSGEVRSRYEPGMGRVSNLPEIGTIRVGLVPFFDTRWLARSSGYEDGAAVVGAVGGRPVRLVRDGRTALVSEFVHHALFRELSAAGFFVEDLGEVASGGGADPKAVAEAAERYGDEYLVFGDVVAFDYSYVSRGPGSLWGADVAFMLNVVSLRSKRLLVRELVEDSWRGDPTDEGESEGEIFGEAVIDRWLVNYALRRALARTVDRVVRAVAQDRGLPLEVVQYEGALPMETLPPPATGRPPEPAGASRAERAYLAGAGTLRVESDPPGARVTLGDRELGVTPLETRAEPGAVVDLLVQMEGRRPLLESVRMPRQRGLSVRAVLAPLAGEGSE